jgi:hypothetical protein
MSRTDGSGKAAKFLGGIAWQVGRYPELAGFSQ